MILSATTATPIIRMTVPALLWRLALLLMLVLPAAVIAQPDIARIKLSGDYYWGSATSMERQEALDLARQDLLQRILVVIVSSSELVQQEVDFEFTSSFQMRSRSLSRMELRGLDYHAEQKRDRSWEVTAFLSKTDFDRSVAVETERIFTKLNQAMAQESRGEHIRAMALYHETFLGTWFIPIPLFTDAERHGERADLRLFLRDKLTNWMRETTLTVEAVRSRSTPENPELYIDIRGTYQNQSLEHLSIALDRPGYGQHRFVNGVANVYSDRLPEATRQPQTFKIEIQPASALDPELAALSAQLSPTLTRTLEIDYRDVMKVDFNVVPLTGTRYRLVPQLENITVFDMKWELPDGTVSTESSPSHTFSNLTAPQHIRLTVNNAPNLSVRKALTSAGLINEIQSGPISSTAEGSTRQTPVTNNTDTVQGRDPRRTMPEVPDNRNTRTETPPARNPGTGTTAGSGSASEPVSAPTFQVPARHRTYMDEIIRTVNAEQLLGYLGRLQSDNIVRFGNRTAVRDPQQSYLVIIDPATRRVHAILSPPRGQERLGLTSGNLRIREDDLQETYSGMGSVWIEFLR